MQELKVLRKLSPCELVYDFEHSKNYHILSSALILTAKYDVFASEQILRDCLEKWCKVNPFLRCKIANLESTSNSTGFSFDKNFVLVPLEKLDLMKNVEIYDNQPSWETIYEREFNRQAPLNYDLNDHSMLLWRLVIVKLKTNSNDGLFKFSAILTIHHGISDGRNVFAIMQQLLEIIDKSIANISMNYDDYLNDIPPPLEYYLSTFDTNIESNIDLTINNDDSICKIPSNFNACSNEKSKDQSFNYVTRFEHFIVEEHLIKKILEKCKSNNLKLTGCLNLISIIALNEAYKKFDLAHDSYFYHLMVSLRPFIKKSNDEMGFYASHIDCGLKFDPLLDMFSDEQQFWKTAKIESDKLHERLRRNEHIEMAKQDVVLISELENKQFTNGGGAHFALSNLGSLQSSLNLKLIKIDEFYYQVSLEANRWSSLLFYGLSTLDRNLMWGITYNSKFIRTEIIKFVVNNIQKIFDRLAQ